MIVFRKLSRSISARGTAGMALAIFFGVICGFLMLEAVRALLQLDGLFAPSVLMITREVFENAMGREVVANPFVSFTVRFYAALYLFMGVGSVFFLADKLLSEKGA